MTHKCAFYVNQSKTKFIFAITVNHSRCTVVLLSILGKITPGTFMQILLKNCKHIW